MNNVYEEAIEFFLQRGREIKNVSDLIIRGTSRDAKNCTLHWSDIDVSVVVEKINIEVYDQVRILYERMRSKFPFKISITLVTKSDFCSSRHHHGKKPIYYSSILKNSLKQQDIINQLNKDNIRELQYDCYCNIVCLMHDLRIEDMKRGNDLTAMQEFCCQLLKSSNHLIRNSIFIKTGRIEEKINTKCFRACFPNIDPDLPQKLKSFKKNWPSIVVSPQKLMQIREYILPLISDIYDQVVTYVSNLNYKFITLSNSQDVTISSSVEVGKKPVYLPELKGSKHKTKSR